MPCRLGTDLLVQGTRRAWHQEPANSQSVLAAETPAPTAPSWGIRLGKLDEQSD